MRIVAFCALSLLLCGAGVAPLDAGWTVQTVAGSGTSGTGDGMSTAAQFVMPIGIGAAGDSIYVADAGAQRIRRIQGGRVGTVAGGGDLVPNGLWVVGGYRDGPVSEARFNQPTGVAVARDGTIYVADYANHCIRKIANGIVSTYAGSPWRPGKADGSLATASLAFPRALAFDTDGNLYVADRSVGVRRIGTDGAVVTLPLPAQTKLDLVGIAVTGGAKKGRLFVSDHEGLVVVDLASGKGVKFAGVAEGGRRFGSPDALAPLDADRVVFTDSRSHTIRFFHDRHAESEPAASVPLVDNLMLDAGNNGGGFRDGGSSEALFDAPRGIAALPDGTLVISDTGNRRIRILRGFDARIPTRIANAADVIAGRQALIVTGGETIFSDTLWRGSIPGRLEAAVGQRVSSLMYERTEARRSASAMLALLETHVRTIVWVVAASVDPARDEARSAASQFSILARAAGRSHSHLLIVILPVDAALSPWEQLGGAALWARALQPSAPSRAAQSSSVKSFFDVFDMSQALWDQERSPAHVDLFGTVSPTLTPDGRTFVAGLVSARLHTLGWIR